MKYDWKEERKKYQVWKEPASAAPRKEKRSYSRQEPYPEEERREELPPAATPPGKKKFPWLLIILLLGGGYFLYTQKSAPAAPAPRPAETPAPAPRPAPAPAPKPAPKPAPRPRPTPAPTPRPTPTPGKVYSAFPKPAMKTDVEIVPFGRRMRLELITQDDFLAGRYNRKFTDDVPVARINTQFIRTLFQDKLPQKHDQAYVELYKNMQKTLAFFSTYFNHNSFDNKKGGVLLGYGLYLANKNYTIIQKNAFRFGQGEKSVCFSFGLPYNDLGTVAHEFTHGIVGTKTWNGIPPGGKQPVELIYFGESGALHEGFADIFGMFAQRCWEPELLRTAKRWYIGRYMNDPHKSDDMGNSLPAYYGERGYWKNTDPKASDNGGVHSNQGPMLKWAYLLSEGDKFRGHTVHGMGDEKTGRFFWALLSLEPRLPINATYRHLAARLEAACTACNFTEAEKQNVRNAARAINLPGMQSSGSADSINFFLNRKLAMSLKGGGDAKITMDNGRVSYITFPESSPLQCSLSPDAALRDHVAGFLQRYGRELGVSTDLANYEFRQGNGNELHIQQKYKGIEVFAGTLSASGNPVGGISSIANSLSMNLGNDLNITPAVSREDVIRSLQKKFPQETFSRANLMIYDPALMGGKGKAVLTWHLTSKNGEFLWKRYLVNAATGEIEFSYNLHTSH